MIKKFTLFVLLGLLISGPISYAEELSTPGAGFAYTMKQLLDLNNTLGLDTIQKRISSLPPVIISEVVYDVTGSDTGWEWIELYNQSDEDVDLSEYWIGVGGTNYAISQVPLSGTIASGQTYVIGGPLSGAVNYFPSFDLSIQLNLQNPGTSNWIRGIGLFKGSPGAYTSTSIPVDAVIYGGIPATSQNLLDERGNVNQTDIAEPPTSGTESIVRMNYYAYGTRTSGDWIAEATPSPGIGTLGISITRDMIELNENYDDYFIKDLVEISETDTLSITVAQRLVFLPVPVGESFNPGLSIRGRIQAVGQVMGDVQFTSLAAYITENPVAAALSRELSDVYVGSEKSLIESGFSKEEAIMASDMMVYEGVLGVTVATGALPGQWDKIAFNNPTGVSALRYVDISYADIGISCSSVPEGRLTIENCLIHNNYTGIYLRNSSPLISDNSDISYQPLLYDGDRVVRQTGTGIYIEGSSRPLIRLNGFKANEGNSIAIAGRSVGTLPKLGNILDDEGGENVGRNSFYIVGATGSLSHEYEFPYGQNHIFNETPNTIYAQHNVWGAIDANVIDSEWLYDDDESPDAGEIVFSPFFRHYLTSVDEADWRSYR